MILLMLPALGIYLFYRTEKTVINEIFIAIFSYDTFTALRTGITTTLPLEEHIVYSLPEGLWVFCITLTSKFLFVNAGRYRIHLLYLPLVFSTGLECFQLLHLTNGRFDFWDIGASVLAWVIAAYLVPFTNKRQNILHPFSTRSAMCMLSYLVVYLAHVWG
jgi:hypothetical protein